MAKGVWGIDVSKYSVKAVRLEIRGGGLALTNLDVATFEGAEAGDASNAEEQIKNALLDLRDRNRIGGEPIVIALPGHSTFNRLIKLPPVDETKIPEIIKYEAQSQIPFNIDEVIWDYQIIDREYGPGEEREVILFAIKKDIVEQFLGNLADLKFNIDTVQFAPVALYNFLSYDQEVGKAAVAMDMGSDNTDLVVIDDAKFWVRNLPITGNDITKALEKGFNIGFAEAEKLKIKAGQSQQAQKIFNAIQPVLRDLVGEIHRSIGYYKSISKSIRFDKIWLLGNATKTINFQKFVSQSLQMPANRVMKLNKINSASVDPNALNAHLNTAGTAIGLALQGLGESRNKINLLPAVYRQKKELKKKQPWIIAAAVLLYATVGLWWMTASGEVTKLDRTLADGNAAKKKFDALEQRYKEATQLDALKNSLETIRAISNERDLVLQVFDQINPNLTDNKKEGDEDKKIWIVDWLFEEERVKEAGSDKPKVTEEGVRGIQDADLLAYPTKKSLKVVMQVCVTKRPDEAASEEVRKAIVRQLWNYNIAEKQHADNRPCVIEFFGLQETGPARWEAGRDEGAFNRPLPADLTKDNRPAEGEEQNFWRYKLTLTIPVNKKDRDALKAPPADVKK